jgi:hypothetical protein
MVLTDNKIVEMVIRNIIKLANSKATKEEIENAAKKADSILSKLFEDGRNSEQFFAAMLSLIKALNDSGIIDAKFYTVNSFVETEYVVPLCFYGIKEIPKTKIKDLQEIDSEKLNLYVAAKIFASDYSFVDEILQAKPSKENEELFKTIYLPAINSFGYFIQHYEYNKRLLLKKPIAANHLIFTKMPIEELVKNDYIEGKIEVVVPTSFEKMIKNAFEYSNVYVISRYEFETHIEIPVENIQGKLKIEEVKNKFAEYLNEWIEYIGETSIKTRFPENYSDILFAADEVAALIYANEGKKIDIYTYQDSYDARYIINELCKNEKISEVIDEKIIDDFYSYQEPYLTDDIFEDYMDRIEITENDDEDSIRDKIIGLIFEEYSENSLNDLDYCKSLLEHLDKEGLIIMVDMRSLDTLRNRAEVELEYEAELEDIFNIIEPSAKAVVALADFCVPDFKNYVLDGTYELDDGDVIVIEC